MIRALANVQDPDNVVVQVAVEMKLRDWKLLLEQLPQKWPSSEFYAAVQRVTVRTIERVERMQDSEETVR